MVLATKRARSEPGELAASADLFGPDKSLGYLIRDVHRAFVRELVGALEPYNISAAQWAALRVLWEEQGLTQVQLAERMRTEKAALTAVLDSLERKGYIARSRDQHDRRKSNLYLTRAGQQLKDDLLPLSVVVHDRAINRLSQAELKSVRKLLEHILANLQA
jgi:MarR family transcriptional regulator, organic hydroperoxide resistance regulator